MLGFGDLVAGMRLSGVVAEGDVTVVAVDVHGPGSATLTYRTTDGRLGERIVFSGDLVRMSEVSERRWGFDADGAMFCLASEARRMQQAHLADPFAAVDTSNIEPYPHQIDAVYNRLLTQKPLRFLLADDPGAGKTIMSGLLIRELMLRGDVARCLIVAPGSLVEQWQDELFDKFGLTFELMSRARGGGVAHRQPVHRQEPADSEGRPARPVRGPDRQGQGLGLGPRDRGRGPQDVRAPLRRRTAPHQAVHPSARRCGTAPAICCCSQPHRTTARTRTSWRS